MMRCTIIPEGVDSFRSCGVAGAILFRERQDGTMGGIAFICPCGCGREGYLPMKGNGHPQEWEWDGDRENPTLTPSIYQRSTCGWHGWLRGGEWTT